MRTVFQAADTIEAHMILNLLEQEGISGFIAGEHLQSGVGDLPASGLIRVQVAESDLPEARRIIDDWEAREAPLPDPVSKPRPQNNATSLRLAVALVIGFVIGAAITHFHYRLPVTTTGTDYTGDLVNDERWHYAGGVVSKYETDRNRDGRIDLVAEYDRLGQIRLGLDDNDFDGRFEMTTHYQDGLPTKSLIDADGDEVMEQVAEYSDGVVNTITWFNPIGLKTRKIQHFSATKLEYSELDTDGDGRPDTVVEYDDIEEVTRKSRKSLTPDATGENDASL